jgi:hypothetical protein
MDLTPFLEIDLLNLQENLVPELKRFHKESFDPVELAGTASDLKYSKAIKDYFSAQLDNPSEEFVKYFTAQVYEGIKTAAVVERFTGIVQASLNDFVSERLNEKLRKALGEGVPAVQTESPKQPEVLPVDDTISDKNNMIVTTEEELEAFYAIKSMLVDILPLERITYKDTQTYFAILFDGKVKSWICRLVLDENKKTITFPRSIEEPFEKETTHHIENVDGLYGFKELLLASAAQFVKA